MWSRVKDKPEQTNANRILGLVAEQRKDYAKAERFFQDALAIQRDLGSNVGIAVVLNDLGGLARARRDYDAAEQYYREAIELSRRIGDKQGEADRAGNIGELALNRKQWAEARKWYEQALVLAKEVGRQDLIAYTQYGLARVHEAEGRADLALPLAQEALKIYERLQHRDLAAARELCQRIQKRINE